MATFSSWLCTAMFVASFVHAAPASSETFQRRQAATTGEGGSVARAGRQASNWRHFPVDRTEAAAMSSGTQGPGGATSAASAAIVWLVANPDSPGISVGRAVDLSGASIDFVAIERRRAFARTASTGFAAAPMGLPVRALRISSGFGNRLHPILGGYRMHAGVDLPAPHGAQVVATTDGVVNFASWAGGYGLLVSINSMKGLETRFAHLSAFAVAPGDRVKSGQVIGYVGSTGRSTGPHVHYEVRRDGRPVDPLGHR